MSSTNQAIQALLNKATSTPPCSAAHGCYNMTFTGATIPSLLDQVCDAGACRASRQAEPFSSESLLRCSTKGQARVYASSSLPWDYYLCPQSCSAIHM